MSRLGIPLITAAAVALVACGDVLVPVDVGTPYMLRVVNGEPMPWTTPVDTNSAFLPSTIYEGWVTFLNDSIAERHERFGRPPDSTGPPTLFAEWTNSASYSRDGDRIMLAYHFWSPGSLGPRFEVETLLVVSPNAVVLRETGFIPPLDSIIRRFCKAPSC